MVPLFQKLHTGNVLKKIIFGGFLIALIAGGVLISTVHPAPSVNTGVSGQLQDEWTEQNIDKEKFWTSQPIMSDILYKQGFAGDLQKKAGLTSEQIVQIQNLATQVLLAYRQLDSDARVITADPNLATSEKTKKLKDMGYNQRVLHEVNTANNSLKRILSKDQYDQFRGWVEEKYNEAKIQAEDYSHKPPPDASVPTVVIPQR